MPGTRKIYDQTCDAADELRQKVREVARCGGVTDEVGAMLIAHAEYVHALTEATADAVRGVIRMAGGGKYGRDLIKQARECEDLVTAKRKALAGGGPARAFMEGEKEAA